MGGGGKGKTEYQVAEYYLTLDYGLCHGPLDSINEIWVKEQIVWSGYIGDNSTLYLSDKEAFGGKKKEGGVHGSIDVYMGTDTQTMTGPSAVRYGQTALAMPGYRGIAHMVFRGPEDGEVPSVSSGSSVFSLFFNAIFSLLTPAESNKKGFLWIMNNPYLPATWITPTRIPKGWQENTSAVPRGEVGDRSLFFLLDRSASLSGSEFNAIKSAVLDSLALVELALSLGNRIDLAVRFWSHGANDVSIERTDIDESDLADIIAFIEGTGQLTGGNIVPGYTAAEAWFQATKNDDLAGRSLILVTDANSDDGFSTAASGPAADMLNQSSGDFSTGNGNAVDMYSINFANDATAYTAQLDNTGSDGVPVIDGTNVSGLSNAVRRAILSGLTLDANPAHMVRECLTNGEWGLGVLETDIGDSFSYAAEVLIGEGFGLTMMWTQQSSIEAFVQEVCDHVQGMVYLDPETGLWEMVLIRGDYELDDLISLDPSNCTATNRQRKAMSETTNEIVITFTNPESHEDQSITFQDIANIGMQGGIRSETRNYYGVRNSALAQMIGGRDLRSASYPTFSCDLVVNTTAGKIKPGQVVKFSWPDDGIVDMPLRVYKIDYGKPGDSKMALTVTEDIFGLGQTVYEPVEATAWEDTKPVPQPLEHISVITTPLPLLLRSGVALTDVEDEDYPSVLVAVLGNTEDQPVDSLILSGDITKTNGEVVVDTLAELPSTPLGILETELDAEAMTTLTGGEIRRVTGLDAEPETGDFFQIGSDDETSEIIMLYTYDDEDDEYLVARGMFDTTPKAWPIGELIWFLSDSLLQIDPSENAAGTESYYLVQTSNSGGVLDSSQATTETFTPSERPYAPHRPADAKVAGQAFTEVSYTEAGASTVPSTISVTWANRNRFDEDTVPPLWEDPEVTPEVGQTTTIRICNRSDGTVVHEYSGIAEGATSFNLAPDDFLNAERYIDVKLYAVRGGIESVQPTVLLLDIERVGYGRNYGYNYGAPS